MSNDIYTYTWIDKIRIVKVYIHICMRVFNECYSFIYSKFVYIFLSSLLFCRKMYGVIHSVCMYLDLTKHMTSFSISLSILFMFFFSPFPPHLYNHTHTLPLPILSLSHTHIHIYIYLYIYTHTY